MPHTINEVLVERLTIVERKARGEEPARRRKERTAATGARAAATPVA